jgi:hypothetical protein
MVIRWAYISHHVVNKPILWWPIEDFEHNGKGLTQRQNRLAHAHAQIGVARRPCTFDVFGHFLVIYSHLMETEKGKPGIKEERTNPQSLVSYDSFSV